MQSLLAGWRLSLRRTRADWPIVAAGWLITLLATVMFAAGPIYSSSAALAGLRRTLADAPIAETSVQVSVYGTPAQAAGVDADVQADLAAALAPLRAPIYREGRASATLAFAALPDGTQVDDRAQIGFLDGVAEHARLTAGAWPAPTEPMQPVEAVVLDTVAADLGLGVGDELVLVAPRQGERIDLPIRLVGTFAVDDAADPFWYGDAQLTTGGLGEGAGDRVLGPFLTTAQAILANEALSSVSLRWRAFPDFGGLTIDNVGAIRSRLESLAGRLPTTSNGRADVATGLPPILAGAGQSLLVSRTQMLLIMAQLALMAAYAILLTASLLVDHRRVETALLRSRGAGPGHIAWLAVVEGLIIVVPAVLLAPWLAVAEATVLNVAGPLAEIGLSINPAVTTDSYVLAGAAGLLCLAMLVLPAFLAARSFASEERDLSRQETRTLGQRLGLDIALLVVSAIALWQLRLYGAPLTRTVQGSLGFDPLLVAAPAVGLLAGGILALRVLPLLAAGFESWMSRGREVVASLGSRQLARRPLRYTRTALLLILAMSLGVFALSYAETWSTSQQHQARYQAGADVRAVVPNRPGVTPVLPAEYAALPGVEAAMPVERITSGISLGAGRVDHLLALEASTAASVVRARGDESERPFAELMRALHDGRPEPALVALPENATQLRIVPRVDIREIMLDQFPDEPAPIDPATLTGVGVTAAAIVRDAHGLFYRLTSDTVDITQPNAAVVVPLAESGALEGPLELTALELVLDMPRETFTTDAWVGVASWSAHASVDGSSADLPLDGWSARMAPGRNVLQRVADSNVDGMAVHVDGSDELFLFGGPSSGHVLFMSAAIDALDAEVPVVANAAFVAANGAAAGETIDLTIEGVRRTLRIAGVVDAFPTTDPSEALLVFDQPTLGLLRLQPTGTLRAVNEWWLSVSAEQSPAVEDALRGAPFDSPEVVSALDRTRSLSTDPVALGIIGALLLGFVATGFFALVALIVSATVSARQRRTEFALLRALGLTSGQLSRWLWLENGSLVVVSLLAGTAVGVVMSWIALPFITVTQQAAAPVPAVVVQLPWDRILVLEVLVIGALAVAVAVLATVLRRIGVGTILRMGED